MRTRVVSRGHERWNEDTRPGMNTPTMPHRGEMITAFLSRDGSYDGVFFTGVLTTGIFCRPTCPAKKPREDNVEFFSSTQAALLAGFRPCKR